MARAMVVCESLDLSLGYAERCCETDKRAWNVVSKI